MGGVVALVSLEFHRKRRCGWVCVNRKAWEKRSSAWTVSGTMTKEVDEPGVSFLNRPLTVCPPDGRGLPATSAPFPASVSWSLIWSGPTSLQRLSLATWETLAQPLDRDLLLRPRAPLGFPSNFLPGQDWPARWAALVGLLSLQPWLLPDSNALLACLESFLRAEFLYKHRSLFPDLRMY